MDKFRFIILLVLLFGGGLAAQWGDCFTYDIKSTGPGISDPYVDDDGDGCRDDNYKWSVTFHSMLMNGAPQSPNGAYHRIQVEIFGTNSFDYSNPQLLHTRELNPDNFTYYDEGLTGYRSSVHYRMENAPQPFKYGFMRTRILHYIWHNYGSVGYYVGFSGDYCDSPIRTMCNGATGGSGNNDPDPKPDLLKGTNGSLTTSEGTTLIDGLGAIPKLRPGASFNYNVDCKNEGNATASNFRIQTYVNTSNTFSPPSNGQGPNVGFPQYVGTLAENASVNHNQTDWVNNHSSKFSSSGYRYFHTFFDDEKVVDESAEGNNAYSQVAYYYHSGSGDPAGREGIISLNHLNTSNEISFLYEDWNPLSNQMESKIGTGLEVSIFPAGGAMQLQLPVFQATVNQRIADLDISGLSPGLYRVVINGHFIKRFMVN